jgi:hypothetical protein
MRTDYSHMDKWTDKEVTEFKEKGKESEFDQIEIISGVVKYLSEKRKIVSEGDSWFDYIFGTDIIDCLRNHHDYYIKNYAEAGDTLENMIYGTEINRRFQRTTPSIYKVLRKIGKLKPNVFLFSGGGNDIAGDEFGSFLNHKDSSLPPLRVDYVNNMVNTVFKRYFIDLTTKIGEISPNTHIVTHGYGHTLPTGKGVGILGYNFLGPWLRPALAMKGIFDSKEQFEIVKTMIDSYSEMLKSLDQTNNKFHFVDLRKAIDPYNDWVNELHLKNSAYAKVADLLHKKIQEVQS